MQYYNPYGAVNDALFRLGDTFKGISEDSYRRKALEGQQDLRLRQMDMEKQRLAGEQEFGLKTAEYEQWKNTPDTLANIVKTSRRLNQNPGFREQIMPLLAMPHPKFPNMTIGQIVTTPGSFNTIWNEVAGMYKTEDEKEAHEADIGLKEAQARSFTEKKYDYVVSPVTGESKYVEVGKVIPEGFEKPNTFRRTPLINSKDNGIGYFREGQEIPPDFAPLQKSAKTQQRTEADYYNKADYKIQSDNLAGLEKEKKELMREMVTDNKLTEEGMAAYNQNLAALNSEIYKAKTRLVTTRAAGMGINVSAEAEALMPDADKYLKQNFPDGYTLQDVQSHLSHFLENRNAAAENIPFVIAIEAAAERNLQRAASPGDAAPSQSMRDALGLGPPPGTAPPPPGKAAQPKIWRAEPDSPIGRMVKTFNAEGWKIPHDVAKWKVKGPPDALILELPDGTEIPLRGDVLGQYNNIQKRMADPYFGKETPEQATKRRLKNLPPAIDRFYDRLERESGNPLPF